MPLRMENREENELEGESICSASLVAPEEKFARLAICVPL